MVNHTNNISDTNNILLNNTIIMPLTINALWKDKDYQMMCKYVWRTEVPLDKLKYITICTPFNQMKSLCKFLYRKIKKWGAFLRNNKRKYIRKRNINSYGIGNKSYNTENIKI